jgi:hypothetical protein
MALNKQLEAIGKTRCHRLGFLNVRTVPAMDTHRWGGRDARCLLSNIVVGGSGLRTMVDEASDGRY